MSVMDMAKLTSSAIPVHTEGLPSSRSGGSARPGRGGFQHERALRARYDAAQTTRDNAKHWGQADNLLPLPAIPPASAASCAAARVMRSPTTAMAGASSRRWPTMSSAQGPCLQILLKNRKRRAAHRESLPRLGAAGQVGPKTLGHAASARPLPVKCSPSSRRTCASVIQ